MISFLNTTYAFHGNVIIFIEKGKKSYIFDFQTFALILIPGLGLWYGTLKKQ